jgi:hypothetical protein
MKSMSSMKVGHLLQRALLLVSAISLCACGFHLRENVKLPASIQKVHIVTGVGDFQRMLARALEVAGVDVKDEGGPGIAELRVPVAAFSTDTLTAGGYATTCRSASSTGLATWSSRRRTSACSVNTATTQPTPSATRPR